MTLNRLPTRLNSKSVTSILLISLSLLLAQNCGSFYVETIKPESISHSSTSPTETPQFQSTANVARIGDRYATAEILKNIFMPLPEKTLTPEEESLKQAFNEIIEVLITSQAASFGGPCSFLKGSDDCRGEINDGLTAVMLANSSSSREALKMRACETILTFDESIGWALDKAYDDTGLMGLKITDSPLKLKNLERAFGLFYPGKDISNETLARFVALADESLRENSKQIDAWRIVLLALCDSPGWEFY